MHPSVLQVAGSRVLASPHPSHIPYPSHGSQLARGIVFRDEVSPAIATVEGLRVPANPLVRAVGDDVDCAVSARRDGQSRSLATSGTATMAESVVTTTILSGATAHGDIDRLIAQHNDALLREARLHSKAAAEVRQVAKKRQAESDYLARFQPFIEEAKTTTRLIINFQELPRLPAPVLSCSRLTVISLVALGLDCLPDAFPVQLRHSLTCLSLSSNKLTDLPPSLARMASLRELTLVKNRFRHLPDAVCELTRLEGLHLHTNLLEDLPAGIAQLKQLRSLNLDCNQLSSLPSSMASMPVERLNLNRNAFSSIPSWLRRLRNLEHLSVCHNQLQAFPEVAIDCPRLTSLSLATNRISSLPERIGECTQLRALVLDWNHIEVLPLQVEHLTALETLKLEGNPLKRPSLQFVLENGPQGLFQWAQKSAKMRVKDKRRRTVEQFLQVLETVAREGLAPPTVLTTALPMEFEGQIDEYYAIVWPVFASTVLPQARRLWLRSGLPVVGERFDMAEQCARVLGAPGHCGEPSSQPDCRDGASLSSEKGCNGSSSSAPAPLESPAQIGVFDERVSTIESEADAGAGVEDSVTALSAVPFSRLNATALARARTSRGVKILGNIADDWDAPGTFWSRPSDELLGIILAYRDATGPVAREGVYALFRECACAGADGKRRACTSPRPGFKCMRRCVVLKVKPSTRRDLEIHQDSVWQANTVDNEVAVAARAAEAFIASDEGVQHFAKAARDQADIDEQEAHRLEFEALVINSFAAREIAVKRRHNQARAAVTAAQHLEVAALCEEEARLLARLGDADSGVIDLRREHATMSPSAHVDGKANADVPFQATQSSALSNLAKLVQVGLDGAPIATPMRPSRKNEGEPVAGANGKADSPIYGTGGDDDESRAERLKQHTEDLWDKLTAVRRQMEAIQRSTALDAVCRSEEREIEALRRSMEATKARYRAPAGVLWGIRCGLSKSFRHRVGEHKRMMERAYVMRRRQEARFEAEARLSKMRQVMQRWKTAGTKPCFAAWREWTREQTHMRFQASKADASRAALLVASKEVGAELQRLELAKWLPHTDPVTDLAGFVHTETGEWRSSRPILDEVVYVHRRS